MRLLEPPGPAWLLRHELRLGWRAFGTSRRLLLGFGVAIWMLFHLPAWGVVRVAPPHEWLARAPAFAIAAEVFVLLLVLSWAFGLAVRAIFDRGDLDLLVSSPVPATHFYATRAGYVAVASLSTIVLVAAPFANAAALQGHPGALLFYPVMLALGLAAAAIAFAGTLGLARLVGARRARTLAQLLGAFVGAAFLIATQAQVLLSPATRVAIGSWLRSGGGSRWLGAESPLAWPLRAATGELLPAAATVAAGVAIFCAVIASTQRAFVDTANRGLDVAPRRTTPRRAARAFASGLARVVVTKELKLIARDPLLIAKSLLQVLYLVPLLFLFVRSNPAWRLIGPAVVVMTANLAASLAWIAISAEEAPDLVASAPVSRARIETLKLAAALLGPCVLTVPFVAFYAAHSAIDALLLALLATAAMATGATIERWSARPAARESLAQRHKDNLLVGFAETFASLGWGGALYLALGRNAYAPLPAAVPAAALLVAGWLRRR
jgi:ABC-2 type transport system permease protein